MSPLEKVPFATFYPLQMYLRGTCFFKNDFFKWTQESQGDRSSIFRPPFLEAFSEAFSEVVIEVVIEVVLGNVEKTSCVNR